MPTNDLFLRACRRQPVESTPIWLMRQAGRYMPEYRQLRQSHSLLELIRNPDLAAEITLQPVQAFPVDAAIIFADILLPLDDLGLGLDFVEGDGPVLNHPIRTAADVDRLTRAPRRQQTESTVDAVRRVCRELNGKIPLIGFVGAPFTLASYAIEGNSSREFLAVKRFMYADSGAWAALMEKLSAIAAEFLCAQIAAGCRAAQLFDSWAGHLSPLDYAERVLPYLRSLIHDVRERFPDVPIIYFGTGTAGLLPWIRQTGAQVIGVDWRVELLQAWDALGEDVAIQGNLDPIVLCSSTQEIRRQARHILDQVGARNGHIFNLGHGVSKETPVENVRALVDYVHEYSRAVRSET